MRSVTVAASAAAGGRLGSPSERPRGRSWRYSRDALRVSFRAATCNRRRRVCRRNLPLTGSGAGAGEAGHGAGCRRWEGRDRSRRYRSERDHAGRDASRRYRAERDHAERDDSRRSRPERHHSKCDDSECYYARRHGPE